MKWTESNLGTFNYVPSTKLSARVLMLLNQSNAKAYQPYSDIPHFHNP